MKRKTLSILVVVALLILAMPAGLAYAKAQPQNIAFDLTGSWQEDGIDPDTGEPTSDYYDASVTLTGKISDKGGAQYLTPLNGTIGINGGEYKIQLKSVKQSEPLYSVETRYDLPYLPPYSLGGYIIQSITSGVMEANIEGNKFIGFLQWHSSTQYDNNGEIVGEPTGGSTLVLFGIAGSKYVEVSLDGDAPGIE